MVVRDCEVDVRLTVRTSIQCCFNKMFLHRCTRTILILMEQQQTLRQLTIVQTLCLKQVCYNSLILAVLNKITNTLAFVLLTFSTKSLLESKLLYIFKEVFLKICCRLIIVSRKERKEILEHSARSTTRWYELHNGVLITKISSPFVNELLYLCRIKR